MEQVKGLTSLVSQHQRKEVYEEKKKKKKKKKKVEEIELANLASLGEPRKQKLTSLCFTKICL